MQITGAANGLGKEIAMYLAKNYRQTILVLWDIDQEGNEFVKKFAEDFGAKAFAYTVNVADRFEVETFAAKVREITYNWKFLKTYLRIN